MEPERAREISERDQLWASLRNLRGEIERLGAGDLDGSELQGKVIKLLARIVVAELDFRFREMEPE